MQILFERKSILKLNGIKNFHLVKVKSSKRVFALCMNWIFYKKKISSITSTFFNYRSLEISFTAKSIDHLVFFIKNNFQHFNFWISIVLEYDKQRLSTLILNNLNIPSYKLNRLFFDMCCQLQHCHPYLQYISRANFFFQHIYRIYSTSCIILSQTLRSEYLFS